MSKREWGIQQQLDEVRERVVQESLDILRREGEDRENEAYLADRFDPRWNIAQEAAEAREMALQRRESIK